ncbi:terpenoid synthase [Mollisia scopiformis]|uniref:Terpene synthase n=1 Tax=Mollisia scopiformis TaxID=149040 RepID=A0A194WY55_MOLSC|nr:terpenoid synthase [Mollisia scopiformis]KUJ12619.1 terpenoid synthase [Mollisia scopiformis]
MASRIFFPDLEANWMWPRRVNPHTPEIKQECLEWVGRFGAFTPAAQKAFDKCDFNQLRSACDLMNLFFIFDEHSDKCNGDEVWNQVDIIMDAFHFPEKPRPEGEWIGGEVARQFWSRIIGISTPTFQKRFLDTWEEYLQGTAQQAEDRCRSKKVICDIATYLTVRRRTIGARPSFNIIEIDMDLPDEVVGHPTIRELELLATDLTIIANDILSYNKEQASGDDEHNLITIVMKEQNTDVQGAIDWTAKLHAEMIHRFNKLYLFEIPKWGGPLDLDVQSYVNGMAQWVGAYVQWSYESERYFGKRGLEVKKTRMLSLLPKNSKVNGQGEIGPVVLDDLSL